LINFDRSDINWDHLLKNMTNIYSRELHSSKFYCREKFNIHFVAQTVLRLIELFHDAASVIHFAIVFPRIAVKYCAGPHFPRQTRRTFPPNYRVICYPRCFL